MVKAVSVYILRSLILSGHQVVVVDETNYSRAAREALKDDRWRVVFYEITTSPEVCKERAIATGQPDLLPVIDGMYARYEPLSESDERFVEVNENGTIITSKERLS